MVYHLIALMKMHKLKYYKEKLLAWFLTLTLFLSLFTFLGYSNKATLFHHLKIQTELVNSTNTKPNSPTIAFKKTISIPPKIIHLNKLTKYRISLLLSYNKLMKVRLQNISQQYHSIKKSERFLPIKNIPCNACEYVFIYIG